MTDIDMNTGLPVLPEDHFWEVRPLTFDYSNSLYVSGWTSYPSAPFTNDNPTHAVAIVRSKLKTTKKKWHRAQTETVNVTVANKWILRQEVFLPKDDSHPETTALNAAKAQVKKWKRGGTGYARSDLDRDLAGPFSVYALDPFVDQETIARAAVGAYEAWQAQIVADAKKKADRAEQERLAVIETARLKQFEGKYPPKTLR